MDTRCTCRIVKAPTYEVYVQEPCGIHLRMVEDMKLQNQELQKVVDAAIVIAELPLTTPRSVRETAELGFWAVVDEHRHKSLKRNDEAKPGALVDCPVCGGLVSAGHRH